MSSLFITRLHPFHECSRYLRILRRVKFHAAIVLIAFANPVSGQQINAVDTASREAMASVGKQVILPVPFPACVMQFLSQSDMAEYRGESLRNTFQVDLKVGWSRGTIAYNKNAGDVLLEVVCGSDLVAATASPL